MVSMVFALLLRFQVSRHNIFSSNLVLFFVIWAWFCGVFSNVVYVGELDNSSHIVFFYLMEQYTSHIDIFFVLVGCFHLDLIDWLSA